MKKKKIFVAGHNGMVGSAICRLLSKDSQVEVITRERSNLDLLNQNSVNKFIKNENPDNIIFAAAKVGGILANKTFPADFIYENLQIQTNVINAAHINNVQNLLFLGSSCIYPKLAEQPIKEEELLTGKLEPTNAPYAIAKIAGIKMCESYNRQYKRDYRSVMPTNLYGPNDSYHPENSHVIPALLRRFHEAKIKKADHVVVWGSGGALREFLYVDDLAAACVKIMDTDKKLYYQIAGINNSHLNIGTGKDISIKDLAKTICEIVGFSGKITFDKNKPDGTPRKLLDINKVSKLGWKPETPLRLGLQKAYRDFISNNI